MEKSSFNDKCFGVNVILFMEQQNVRLFHGTRNLIFLPLINLTHTSRFIIADKEQRRATIVVQHTWSARNILHTFHLPLKLCSLMKTQTCVKVENLKFTRWKWKVFSS